MILRLLVSAVLSAALFAAPAQARLADHNPVETTDATGDSGGAPDITGVTVANDFGGNILFVIEVGNRTGFAANDLVAISIDSDRNARTGTPTGSDYVIAIDAGARAVALLRWIGTTLERVATTTLRPSDWGPGYVALINRSELGDTTTFDYRVVTFLAVGDDADLAPATGSLTYTLASPHIEAIAARFSTTVPRAGKSFRLSTVRLTFETGETAIAARFTCRATLAGKRIRGTGPGACTFKLPKSAKGKKLVITITATAAGGRPETFAPYAFKVR